METQAFDRDIYYVERDENGNTTLNVQRYYFENEGYIMCTEYTGVRLTPPVYREEFEDAIYNSNQYCGRTSKRAADTDVSTCIPLDITEVTDETPCGKYIDIH